MKTIHGIKIGGLQQKIINLMLIFIAALIIAYTAAAYYYQQNLAQLVERSAGEQQAAIASVSEQTMEAVLDESLTRSTALQAYIADDLFGDVRSDVMTLRALATQIFTNAESFPPHAFALPDITDEGTATVKMQHEEGVDPYSSASLALAANMSDVMLAMYRNSDKLNSCFIATTDGCILIVDDRAGTYFSPEGELNEIFPLHDRPWYKQVTREGRLIFTGVDSDTYTGNLGLVCAAPVYAGGKLVAVVGADIFLTSISDYIENMSTDGNYLCVVSNEGQMLFSPQRSGTFKVELSDRAPDLRQSENASLAAFVSRALKEKTGIERITVDGKDVYLCGVPLPTLGWTVLSVVEQSLIRQPTEALISSYEKISAEAIATYEQGTGRSLRTVIAIIGAIVLLAVIGALTLGSHIVRPLEQLTRTVNAQSGGEGFFVMDEAFRTDDEIQILAEAFTALSHRTQDYIREIISITAETKRIGTELALAQRIQADMLPNIFPAFPDRPDFDIYASMDPAKEVGGDFYDFFLIDDSHLGIVMADVSGKGVPAALFMMGAKILVQNYAMTGRSPSEVLRAANTQICANNREGMFITVWFGVMDLNTGKITAANAGHEYPAVMLAGEKFELTKDPHSFVIGGMKDVTYKEYEFTLTPGSKLFLYTDGVPEASNAANQLFGTDRMLSALNKNPTVTPEAILSNVREAVNSFVQTAEQFDDLTMLCVEYKGRMLNNSFDKENQL